MSSPATHLPQRPSWCCAHPRCARRGLQWPCPVARTELLIEHVGNPTALSILMWTWAIDAARDGLTPAQIWDRLWAWTPGTAVQVRVTGSCRHLPPG